MASKALTSGEIIKLVPHWAVVCADIAPLVTTVFRLSPMPTVIKFVRRGTVDTLPLMPYTAVICNSTQWLLFGILLSDQNIILPHMFGIVMTLIYSLIYMRIYNKSGNRKDLSILPGKVSHHIFLILINVFVSLAIVASFTHEYSKQVIGIIANFGSIFMYTGPLTALKRVVREKNAAPIPLPFTFMGFMNGLCWFAYGWYIGEEFFIWGPALIGLVLTTIQLSLILFYGSKDNRNETIELKKMTVEEYEDEPENDSLLSDVENLLSKRGKYKK